MIDNMKKYEAVAEKLKAMAHPHRLCILKGLLERKCNVTKIQECLELPQSTVSQHLGKLKAAGIIEGQRRGPEICYRVVDMDAAEMLKSLFHVQEREESSHLERG